MGTWIAELGGGVALGITLWSLLEYVLHRWVFHRSLLGRWAARQHLQHHAKVSYFYPLGGKLLLAIPVLAPILLVSVLALGLRVGISVPAGVLVGWGIYEVIHRRIHTAAPLGAYGRWARRHHLLHHFGRSNLNHGVSTPIWDVVFGTLAPREKVRVPRQHAAKFPWLLEPAPQSAARVASAFAGDYRIV